MSTAPELRSLRDQPFELLRELERRSQAGRQGGTLAPGADAGEWVGVALQSGEQRWLVPREEIREVMEFPPTTRVPGARDWVRGITNVRGRLVPVMDLLAFRGAGNAEERRGNRLIVVNHQEIPAAVLVDEVMGFRRFATSEFVTDDPAGDDPLAEFSLGQCRRGQESWPVLSLIKLIESARFADMAA